MKNLIVIFLISTTVAHSVFGGTGLSDNTKLGLFIRADFGDTDPEAVATFEWKYLQLISYLSEKKSHFRSDESFLHYVFYKVHRKLLGEYNQYASFSSIFTKAQQYDCVTATALYALILEDLGYDYEIRETDYHVYLLAKTETNSYLFEATDPLYGFAADEKEIDERRNIVIVEAKKINEELAMSGVASQSKEMQDVSVIDNSVTLKELAGLHYYNQALKQFNNEDYRKAYQYIVIAQGIYPSQRIKYASSFMFSVAFGD